MTTPRIYTTMTTQLYPGGPICYLAPHACRGWSELTERERKDVESGLCVYREHEGIPILDYIGEKA